MIKRISFIVFSCIVLSLPSAFACDGCGVSASNMGFGIMSNFQSNFIQFGYLNQRFNSNPEHEYTLLDDFVSWNLTFRFAVGKNDRLRFVGQLPYGIKSRKTDLDNITEQGFSDINFSARYVLIDNLPIGKSTNFLLEVGAGTSLPTGKFNANISDENLPENFNIGKGSFGTTFQTNAIFNINEIGIVWSNSYQFNSKTKEDYQFGSQWLVQLNAYRAFPIKQFNLIPTIGSGLESTSRDRYKNGNDVPETGGTFYFVSSALNLQIADWIGSCTFYLPLSNNSENEMVAKERFAFQLTYTF